MALRLGRSLFCISARHMSLNSLASSRFRAPTAQFVRMLSHEPPVVPPAHTEGQPPGGIMSTPEHDENVDEDFYDDDDFDDDDGQEGSKRRATIVWSMDDDQDQDLQELEDLRASFQSIRELEDDPEVSLFLQTPSMLDLEDDNEEQSDSFASHIAEMGTSDVDEKMLDEYLALQQETPLELEDVVRSILQMKGKDVSIVEIPAGARSYADWMVIVSGNSKRHLRAMAEEVAAQHQALQEASSRGRSLISGRNDDFWMILRTGSIICHFMVPEAREYYKLETLWSKEVAQDDE